MDPTRTDGPVAAEYGTARRETRDGDNQVITGQPDTGDTRGVGDGERRAAIDNPERSTDARQVATPVTADGRTEVNCSVECARTPEEGASDTNALVTVRRTWIGTMIQRYIFYFPQVLFDNNNIYLTTC